MNIDKYNAYSLSKIGNSRQYSSSAPEPDTDCCMADLSEEGSILVRRKRLNLRRIRSFSSVNSKSEFDMISSEEKKNCSKRKRNELLLFSTPVRVGRLEKRDEKGTYVERGGTSNYGASVHAHSPERIRGLEESVEKEEEKEKVTCMAHGSISVIGRRREMEDVVAIKEMFVSKGVKKYDFFGVYDGHGGARVAHACSERLHEVIAEEMEEEEEEGVMDWEKVMVCSFRKMDIEVNRTGGAAVGMMGSTVVVVVVGEEELVVANCGDSRVVLFQDGAPIPLSDDHKPDRPDELARIEDGGGKVINWNGQRVLGVLATSRSIGDHCLKPFVISEPEVRVMRRTDKDEFIILASDGLWDVISNELACEIVKSCLDGHLRRSCNTSSETGLTHAAALLAELAIARGSTDNISVIVIELQRF